jgi:hypothetical protein
MNIEEVTDFIKNYSHAQGEPLTHDVALGIARLLFSPPPPIYAEPGFIAQNMRERYEEGQKEVSEETKAEG